MSPRCYSCGGPTKGGPCRHCSRRIELEARAIPRPTLPQREPEPSGIAVCSCGAIELTSTAADGWRCAECIGGAA